MKTPQYRLHKASGQARVILHGKHVYLGEYNSPESLEKYNAIVAEFEATHAQRSTITIARLSLRFLEHAKTYYRKPDGTPTREALNFQQALRTLCREFRDLPLRQFGPLKLQQVRDAMVREGLARTTVNARMRRIRQVIKWAVSQELCLPSLLTSLQSVEALRIGRTTAPETKPVGPVDVDRVMALKPHLSRPVWAAVQFMLLTGARPGEAIKARWSEIDTTKSIWIYSPGQHKTKHRGKGRQIVIGPECQKVLNALREHSRSDFVFDPQVGVDEHANKNYRPNAKRRQVGEFYSTFSLGTAIRKACERAFGCPPELTTRSTLKKKPGESDAAFKERRRRASEWRHENCWHPNQLRHTKACQLREQFDLETAQVVLGHSSKTTTERYYAELDLSRALKQAEQFG